MSLKLEFIDRARAPGANVSALCREYGISRQTGHKWLKRFTQGGFDGLEEMSRRPRSAPLATAEDVVVAIVAAREAHPRWGPRKLAVVLSRQLGEVTPSARTIARVLDRFGRIRKRHKKRGLSVVERAPDVVAHAPNDVWTVDFKGWWRAVDGTRCEPLTVRDAFSRFVLAIRLNERTNTQCVRPVFERLFRRYGVPKAIKCDNGSPFVCMHARAGLTTLSAWWVSLGIDLVRSRPGCPQDNGAHERMHADVSLDLQTSPAANRDTQQRACDRWRQEFNHVRPHDALGGRTPAELYKPVPRAVRPRIAMYPSTWLVRTVRHNGDITCAAGRTYVSLALAGQRVGLEPVGGLRWRIWFYKLDVGTVELDPVHVPADLRDLKNAQQRRAS